jgi:hypothetical protein
MRLELEGGLTLFSWLPRRCEPVEKLPRRCFRFSIRVQKRLFRSSKARFGASRAALCSQKRAWIEFFNRLVSSRQLGGLGRGQISLPPPMIWDMD